MKWLAYRYLKLRGWQFRGEAPDIPKMIMLGAPHTSNFDFVLFLGTIYYLGVEVKFLGKHQLFRWPFGFIFRAWGGIPVNRRQAGGVVGQTKRAFDSATKMILVIAPEGTRSATGAWKSGFIKIAEAANVPVVPAGVDGPGKVMTVGEPLEVGPSFMDEIREFYANQPGYVPAKKGPVRIRNESTTS